MTGYTQTSGTEVDINALLFTHTDADGQILNGNAAFQKMTGFEDDQLAGAPHNIVRHADMPQGLFHLLWDTIKQGRAVGAYIRNRAQDGSDHWVYSTLLPVADGYVALMLKPSGQYFEKIIPIYERMRKEESENGLSPRQSAELLINAVQEMDFAGYDEFMSFALRDESWSRDQLLQREISGIRDSLAVMFKEIREMEACAARVEETFDRTHQIPYNMRLQAGRLEASDGPISVISGNHRQMTQNLEDHLARFGRESSVGADAIRLALFKTAVASLIEELIESFDAGYDIGDGDAGAELHLLENLARCYRDESLNEVGTLADRVRGFGQHCRDMRRMMSGLELTRIMCKIERSKFDGDHSGLDEIVNRLSEAQRTLGQNFDDILTSVNAILSRSEEIQRSARSPKGVAAA